MKNRRCALVVGLMLASAGSARAAGTRAASEPLVILTEEGHHDGEDAAFLASIHALAAEIGIGVSTQQVPSFAAVRDALLAEARRETKPFLVAWIARESSSRTIHLFDPWKNQLRTRPIEVGASETANGETLALILRAELLAYLNEPPPPPPPPPSPPPPPPPLRSDPSWALDLAYVAGTFLRDHGLQQGLRLGLGHRWSRLRVGAHYGFVFGQDIRTDDVSLTVRSHPFDIDVGYASPEHGRLRLVAEAFLSGDWLSRHTSSAAAPLSAQPDDRRFLVGGGLRGRLELRIFRHLALQLGIGTEIPFNPHEFQIVRGTYNTTIARLSPVRVSGQAAVSILAF